MNFTSQFMSAHSSSETFDSFGVFQQRKMVQVLERAAADQTEAENSSAPINRDVLEAIILSRLPLSDMVAASRVSRDWRRSVSTSLRITPRLKPWFIVYALHPLNHSLTSTFAFDPFSRVWIRICNTHFTTITSGNRAPLRSSGSHRLIYSLSTTKFSFSFDPFHLTWQHVKAPFVWRENPIVVRTGSGIIVAGGTCNFGDDDPLAVEMYDIASGGWEICPSMPYLFRDFATSTWISTAASDNRKLYLLEKRYRMICCFDAETKKWGETLTLNLVSNPNDAIINTAAKVSDSTIGFVDHRLILVGLMGEPEDLQGVGVWEVDQETYGCRPIGVMPPEVFEKMRSATSPLSTMRASIEGGLIYMYDPGNPEQLFFCELKDEKCEWGFAVNPMMKNLNRMQRFVFTCSTVGMGDLEKAMATGSLGFKVET